MAKIKVFSASFNIYGVKKDELSRLLAGIKNSGGHISFSFQGEFPKVTIKARFSNYENKKRAKKFKRDILNEIKRRLENRILIEGDKTPAEILLEKMGKKNLTMAASESCTGGLIGKLITDVPGASNVFLGSLVTYSIPSKISLLGVKREDIEKHTAVSEPVAEAMAVGARKSFAADYAVSTTGIAGPTGGSPEKPVGTVYTGIANPNWVKVRRFNFPGSRQQVRLLAALASMELVKRALENRPLHLEF